MNKKQGFAIGLVSVVAFATLAFVPASADSIESSARAAAGVNPVVALNAAETPQHLVWDMIYGELTPAATMVDESLVQEESQEVTDLSVG